MTGKRFYVVQLSTNQSVRRKQDNVWKVKTLNTFFARFLSKINGNTILGTGLILLSFNQVGTENALYCILSFIVLFYFLT